MKSFNLYTENNEFKQNLEDGTLLEIKKKINQERVTRHVIKAFSYKKKKTKQFK